ncbi:MAG: mechanosensitive ion channel domain-containing protein [Oceanicaulis sp.]
MLRLLRLLAVLLVLAASPALAQQDTSADPAPDAPIAADAAPEDDSRIARRIEALFSEIEALAGVSVSVEAGVVTLSGETGAAEAARRAEALAARVEGVATVENRIERDVSLSGRVDPALGEAGERLRAAVRALPLVGLALIVFFAIACLGWLVAGRAGLWRRLTPNLFIAELVSGVVRVLFLVIAVIAALTLLDATALLGALLGAAGVAGLAVGFAVKDTIENYVASVMLSVRQPFRPNDHVVIDGKEGRVIRLTSRATVLMTLDGNHLRIPNGAVFKAVILNYTRNAERRFDFALGVDADDDAQAAAALGVKTLAGLDFVLADPAPAGFIEKAGDSTLNLRFLAWIDQTEADFMKSRSAALAAVKAALETGGFTLPEPIYRLRFDQAPPAPDEAPRPAPPRRAAPVPSDPDTRPDAAIARRVEAERAEEDGSDLLSDTARTE